jgi:hypothetical protein
LFFVLAWRVPPVAGASCGEPAARSHAAHRALGNLPKLRELVDSQQALEALNDNA